MTDEIEKIIAKIRNPDTQEIIKKAFALGKAERHFADEEVDRQIEKSFKSGYSVGLFDGKAEMLEEVKKEIDDFIENKSKRIARGVAYDYDEMKRIWSGEIETLNELKQRLENLNSPPTEIGSQPNRSESLKEEGVDKIFDDFVKELKDKDFIMSILNDCVTVDTGEEMKFICVADVQKKIDKLAEKYRGKK